MVFLFALYTEWESEGVEEEHRCFFLSDKQICSWHVEQILILALIEGFLALIEGFFKVFDVR